MAVLLANPARHDRSARGAVAKHVRQPAVRSPTGCGSSLATAGHVRRQPLLQHSQLHRRHPRLAHIPPQGILHAVQTLQSVVSNAQVNGNRHKSTAQIILSRIEATVMVTLCNWCSDLLQMVSLCHVLGNGASGGTAARMPAGN